MWHESICRMQETVISESSEVSKFLLGAYPRTPLAAFVLDRSQILPIEAHESPVTPPSNKAVSRKKATATFTTVG